MILARKSLQLWMMMSSISSKGVGFLKILASLEVLAFENFSRDYPLV